MTKSIIIAERDNIAAVMEDGKVSEFFIHRGDILLNDIYLAKVDNILPSIEAAFVDVGSDKMGFLHTEDIIGKGALKDKIKPKQNIIVQVVKEPTGHKGPRVTTAVSIPGRFLVLIPNEIGINISKKISTSKERARLKSVVSLLKPVGVGVIVRTEAEGQSEADIQEDLELLLEKWNSIVTAAETVSAPNLLYRDQDLLYKVIREACSEDINEIIVDTAFALHRTQNLVQNWNLGKDIKVSAYKGNDPLLVASGIHKEIKSALQTKINLPSGAYIYIQPTEALTVVDVNSGKFTSSATQEETILKTNIEAVHEIARQLRLRNIGGMIIIDFIDMMSRANKLAVMEELEIALEPDKAKPQVGQLSDLGLVELTRHRQGQTLAEIFTKKCPHCQGNGQLIEEFQFSTSVADGEYRAKAAKLKLPAHQFNKNKQDRNRQHGNQQRNPNPSLIAQSEVEAHKQDVKKEMDAQKLNDLIKDKQKGVDIADAVISYDIIDKMAAPEAKNIDSSIAKNDVAPVLTEHKVEASDAPVAETTEFNQPQKNENIKRHNNRFNNQRRGGNNRNFNNRPNQQNIQQQPQVVVEEAPIPQTPPPAPVETIDKPAKSPVAVEKEEVSKKKPRGAKRKATVKERADKPEEKTNEE